MIYIVTIIVDLAALVAGMALVASALGWKAALGMGLLAYYSKPVTYLWE